MKHSTNNEETLELKMILLGESAVGKTSIISRYVDDAFSANIMTSTTMSYVLKYITINNQKILLSIWDTVGQERFRSLSKLFFNDTKIVVLVYSITDKKTFEELDFWLNLYKECIGDEAILGIAGNKADLFLEQEVNEEKGEEYAKKNGGIFEMISAKENKLGLDNFINKLIIECLKKFPNLITNKKSIKLFQQDTEREELKAGCCTGKKNKRILRKYSDIIKENKGIINIVFLGEISTGKTNIINRITKKDFNKDEEHTSGLIDYYYKYKNGKMILDVLLNDVDNNKKKSTEFINIIKKSSIYFLVYDVKDRSSFINIDYWIEVIKKIKENIKEDLLYILANKNDLSDGEKNIKSIEEGRNLAQEYNAKFKAISAKDNEGIQGIIEESINSYLEGS